MGLKKKHKPSGFGAALQNWWIVACRLIPKRKNNRSTLIYNNYQQLRQNLCQLFLANGQMETLDNMRTTNARSGRSRAPTGAIIYEKNMHNVSTLDEIWFAATLSWHSFSPSGQPGIVFGQVVHVSWLKSYLVFSVFAVFCKGHQQSHQTWFLQEECIA